MEVEMHKLLVAIDSSENALRALGHAISMAKAGCDIELVLVNAHEPPIVYGEIQVYLTEERAREMLQQHSEALMKPAAELARNAGVKHTTEIRIGDVAQEIARAAEEHGCDGIVMGTRGMGAVGNLLMGSVATKVIHLAKVPVTLVK